jgi:hypothetical protein
MLKQEINKEFIEDIKLSFSIKNWGFDGLNNRVIVPKELTHEELRKNFEIDDSINKFYCLPASRLLNDDEFLDMKTHGFIGKKETALSPYSNIIYSAYYSRSDFVLKLKSLLYSNPKKINNNEVKYFEDLIPYFKEYAKGFKIGFSEFDDNQIKPFLTMFSDKQEYVNKVFEYLTKHLLFTGHSWGYVERGFEIEIGNEISGGFDHGKQQGCFYRAWSIVFSNNNLFAPLFNNYFKTISPPQQELKTNEVKEDDTTGEVKHKSKKDTIWFRVGILFANGTMDKFWNHDKTGIKNEFTAPQIAKEIGVKSSREYISATFGNYFKENSNSDKNIFNNRTKTDLIIKHLESQDVTIVQSFLDKIQTETND